MPAPSIRQRALAGETIAGAMIFEFFVPGIPQILRNAGAQYAIYDREHGGLGFETLKMLAAASRGTGVVPMARVPRGEYHFIARALDNKVIAGAAMDVGRAQDQMPSLSLARRKDVVATPHSAGLTPQAIEHQAFDTVNQVAELVAGRMPPGAANADQATRLARLKG